MYIGEILKSRMKALDIDVNMLADKSLVDTDLIEDILNDKLSLEEIDEFDLELIAKSLYCDINYFVDEEYRKKDLIHSSMNRGCNDIKSNTVKGQLQVVANDFIFLKQIMSEIQ